jgi:hypothetical protein
MSTLLFSKLDDPIARVALGAGRKRSVFWFALKKNGVAVSLAGHEALRVSTRSGAC